MPRVLLCGSAESGTWLGSLLLLLSWDLPLAFAAAAMIPGDFRLGSDCPRTAFIKINVVIYNLPE